MPINIDLAGHTALVTGSTQGVGRSIALHLAEAGANLVLHGKHIDDHGHATLAECEKHDVEVSLIEGDLSGPTESCVERVFREATNRAPHIDLLVNNAGTYRDTSFLDISVSSFEQTMRLNVAAYFFLTQAFAKRWVERKIHGRVLMIGSINGRLAEPTHAGYDTSKGAVEMMVRTLCVELAPQSIRVNGLAPGLFVTPLTEPALHDATMRQWMERHTPNGKVPHANVAGTAAAFLLSDAAEHIHGHMLMVDGGMSVWQQPDPPSAMETECET